MMKHFPKELIAKKNDTEMYIKMVNGSLWMLGGADEPTSWKGTNPIDIVLDEYAEMKEQIWTEILRPILTENKGTITFIFTPKGRNHAWKIFEYAKKCKESTGRKYLLWDYFFYNVNDTNAISEEDLEEAKRDMPEAMYRQEFLCEFIDNAGLFFRRIEQNLWNGEIDINNNKQFQLGADLAKYNDWTVLTPFDLHTFRAGNFERFNQIDWNLQKARIEAMARRYTQGTEGSCKIMLDATGIGDPIFDDLQKQNLNIEPFKFTETSRKQLLENLAILLEQDKIKIPDNEILINELKSFQYQLGERGKIKIKVPEGLHDDVVISLALAVWNVGTPRVHSTIKRLSEFNTENTQRSRFNYEN